MAYTDEITAQTGWREITCDEITKGMRVRTVPDGWFGKAPKSEYVQLPGTDAGVPEIPYAAPIAPVLVRGMALTLHAHHADDLLDMVLPDGWRDVIEDGRAA